MGSTKVEPNSRAVNVDYPATEGLARGNHASDGGTMPFRKIPMYEGRGLKAPMAGETSHKSGSQGRH